MTAMPPRAFNLPEIIGEMQFEDTYRLAYMRGPEGILVGLSERLKHQAGT